MIGTLTGFCHRHPFGRNPVRVCLYQHPPEIHRMTPGHRMNYQILVNKIKSGSKAGWGFFSNFDELKRKHQIGMRKSAFLLDFLKERKLNISAV
jgi:hypothetical protein